MVDELYYCRLLEQTLYNTVTVRTAKFSLYMAQDTELYIKEQNSNFSLVLSKDSVKLESDFR